MNPAVDLRQLAVNRDGAPRPPGRRRHLLSRYGLPAAVLAGFLGVFGWAASDSLLSAKAVTVVPVLATRIAVRQEGAPLFRAAGWVEPRPTPVVVTALTEGVVEEMLIVEGQEVKAGEPVARLIEKDARLALESAEADLQLQQAERDRARAALSAAETNLKHPVLLQAALAEAEAELARKETELANLPFQLRTAEAREELARQDLKSKSTRPGALPALTVPRAESALKVAAAAVEELRGRERFLKREADALRRKRDVLHKQLELKTEQTRQLGEAKANLQAAQARIRQAQVALDTALLRLERLTVRAPIAGRVLALVARPGSRVTGLTPHNMHDSSTVVTLYNPAMLQVRADVRLEDVPRVRPGQAALIETSAVAGEPVKGRVLFATAQADIQKNTLQVKVEVTDPPPVLRPDMLVQVTFLAPPQTGPAAESEELRLLIPKRLVISGEGGSRVWVADRAAGVARLVPVQLGLAVQGDLVEVKGGLNASDRLIDGGREGLTDGQRVRVTGEEEVH